MYAGLLEAASAAVKETPTYQEIASASRARGAAAKSRADTGGPDVA
jgi:hypothetical protein